MVIITELSDYLAIVDWTGVFSVPILGNHKKG